MLATQLDAASTDQRDDEIQKLQRRNKELEVCPSLCPFIQHRASRWGGIAAA